MALRPARCYRDIERPYTRVATRVQRKDFIGGAPGLRIRQFVLGNQTKDFSDVLHIVSDCEVQVRDNALEAFRQKVAKKLADSLGKDNYFVKIRVYPHHILRQNKLASGAGADRLSSGMKHAFGKTIGRAAQIKKGQKIASFVIDKSFIPKVKEIIKKATHKLNIKYHIEHEKHINQKLSGRKKITREMRIARAKAAQTKKEE